MTTKRFTFHHDIDGIDYIQDNTNGYCFIISQLLCDVLNTLHEDNQSLRDEINAILGMIRLGVDDEVLKKITGDKNDK